MHRKQTHIQQYQYQTLTFLSPFRNPKFSSTLNLSSQLLLQKKNKKVVQIAVRIWNGMNISGRAA